MLFFNLFGLLILLVVILIVHDRTKRSGQNEQPPEARDQMWLTYLASFRSVAKTKQEKHLIETLIEGRSADQLYDLPKVQSAVFTEPIEVDEGLINYLVAQDEQVRASLPAAAYQPVVTREPLNNSILLLYFGAFLLVSSIGLFVSLSALDGVLRTIIVALTAMTLYVGGLWLAQTNKKLEQAGVSFIGTGLIIAPLTGIAWYNLVAEQQYGGAIWLITSLICFALYAHALRSVNNSFISYLLIGSFISSIESSVLALNLPSYSYAWGLVVAGLILAVITRKRGFSADFNASSEVSTQFLTPLSILGSITLVPEHGSLQLSITLFLSGFYYTLLAWWHVQQRTNYLFIAQLSFMSSLASASYILSDSITSSGIVLTIITALYVLVTAVEVPQRIRALSLGNAAAVASSIAILLSLGDAWALVSALTAAMLLSLVLWYKFKNSALLQLGGALISIVPFIIGIYALDEDLGSIAQLALCAASSLLLFGLVLTTSRLKSFKPYYQTAAGLYIAGGLLVLIPALALSFTATALVVVGIIATYVALFKRADDSNWLVGSTLVALLPLVYGFMVDGSDYLEFSLSTFAALLWAIGVSFATRQAFVRWVVLLCMFIAPIALGSGSFGFIWMAGGYSLGYMTVMVSCMLARTIARGKLMLSFKVPISSYYTYASQAYVVGYALAGFVALCISLSDIDSQLITSLVLAALAVLVPIIARIEHKSYVLTLLPIIAQALLFSAIRPDLSDAHISGIVAALSTALAISSYLIVSVLQTDVTSDTVRALRLTSVFTAYIGAAMVITQSDTTSVLMPLSLIAASALTYAYNRSALQLVQEMSLSGAVIGLHWLLYLSGVHNIQIHTHILAAVLLGFALWRQSRGDSANALNYGYSVFLVVTVPLALAGLGGNPLYGSILIAEQVGFMIIGSTFGIKFLVRWGLWTGLAAILFQLRGLGYAFLALLAFIIIGVAIYQLQKHSDHQDPKL